MNDSQPTNAEIAVDAALPDETTVAPPTLDRAEGDRLLAEARSLYKVAELVHARRELGGVDSAVLADRSLGVLLRLLLRLDGDDVPDQLSDIVERAQTIATRENLLAEDLGPDILVVREARALAVEGAEVRPADVRRYDRAFNRSREWFRAVEAYLDQRLPSQRSALRRVMTAVLPVSFAFLIGLVIGKHIQPEAKLPSAVLPPAPSVDIAGPGFAGTFYTDPDFKNLALSRTDSALSFNWEALPPADTMPADNFSIRWDAKLNVSESGKYAFYLVSDDGSRLLVDGAMVVDNWGNHATVTKTGELLLEKGIHPIRVEYFDHIGSAMIRFEWSSEFFERRLITSRDLR